LIQEIRKRFYEEGEHGLGGTLEFKAREFALAWLDPAPEEDLFTITHFMGTFDYEVSLLMSDRIGFTVRNETNLASGSHFRDRFEPEYYRSLEELVSDKPYLKKQPLRKVLNEWPVISVLSAKTRKQTQGSEGGGTMWQTFTWSERRLICPADTLWRIRSEPALLDIQKQPNVGDPIFNLVM
jgi:hypothetical protein